MANEVVGGGTAGAGVREVRGDRISGQQTRGGNRSVLSPSLAFLMEDPQCLAEQLRSMAEPMATDWLQSQIAALQGTTTVPPSGTQVRRALRARPPERFSPSQSPQAQSHNGSPDSDPPAQLAQPPLAGMGSGAGRNPCGGGGPQ